VARRREFEQDEVVRAARDLFWERGYASTSLAQLQAATGLSRSSLYETFGSKRRLFDEAVNSYLAEVIGPLLEPMETDGSGRDELVDYFLSLARFLRSAPNQVATRGCLMLNTFMELNDLDADAKRAVRSYRARVRAAIQKALWGSSAVVRDLDGTADVLTAGQIGIMVTSRVDPIQAAKLAETIAADIESWPSAPS
jgi:TetR/AcrR family transcriptional regulator, transcriptional repressor for nem operon